MGRKYETLWISYPQLLPLWFHWEILLNSLNSNRNINSVYWKKGEKKNFLSSLHTRSIGFNHGQWNKQTKSDVSLFKAFCNSFFDSKEENQDFKTNLKKPCNSIYKSINFVVIKIVLTSDIGSDDAIIDFVTMQHLLLLG